MNYKICCHIYVAVMYMYNFMLLCNCRLPLHSKKNTNQWQYSKTNTAELIILVYVTPGSETEQTLYSVMHTTGAI